MEACCNTCNLLQHLQLAATPASTTKMEACCNTCSSKVLQNGGLLQHLQLGFRNKQASFTARLKHPHAFAGVLDPQFELGVRQLRRHWHSADGEAASVFVLLYPLSTSKAPVKQATWLSAASSCASICTFVPVKQVN